MYIIDFHFISLSKIIGMLLLITINITRPSAHPIENMVAKVKPSVVGVGLYDALSSQSHQLQGSGFVFGDGTLIATNYHVVSKPLDPQIVQYRIVFSGTGRSPKIHRAEVVASDPAHDLAILKIQQPLTAASLSSDKFLADGSEVILTGFPIGAVLGLYPATHRGIIAAVTPDIIPSANSDKLTNNMLSRLKTPFMIYQLDITAYPGNSGSPVYSAKNGEVVAVLNKVFIKETKESVLEKPSGISYAIPIQYLRALAKKNALAL
ncbi:MAG: serine protease Do [Paraglaciecola sp.]|jgi:serine protease Do